jgi:hypothetical protein
MGINGDQLSTLREAADQLSFIWRRRGKPISIEQTPKNFGHARDAHRLCAEI